MDEYYFLSFDNTNQAMQAESFLKGQNFSITVIPTPREVTLSCGLSVKFNYGGVDAIKDLVAAGSIKAKGIYHLKRENGVRSIEEIS